MLDKCFVFAGWSRTLSTQNQKISITAKIQEQDVYCLYFEVFQVGLLFSYVNIAFMNIIITDSIRYGSVTSGKVSRPKQNK